MATGALHEPSSSFATTTPAPPAPPKGIIPLRIEVKMASPHESRMMRDGIFLNVLRCFLIPLIDFSSIVRSIPSMVNARRIRAHLSTSSVRKSPVTGQNLVNSKRESV